jgi:hypothetical protein
MSSRRLVVAGLLSFVAGLLWQMPLAAVLPGVLEAAAGRVLLGDVRGPWHEGSALLICRTPDGARHDCGFHRLRLGQRALSPIAELASVEGRARLQGGSVWMAAVDELRLPAAALGAVLPLAGQMQIGGLLRITGEAEGEGRALRKAALAVDWHGQIHGFPFTPQTLDVTGNGAQASLRWRPTEGLPRFEGGVDCDVQAACRGVVHVRTDGSNSELTAFLAAGGVRDPADPGRFEFRVNVR